MHLGLVGAFGVIQGKNNPPMLHSRCITSDLFVVLVLCS